MLIQFDTTVSLLDLEIDIVEMSDLVVVHEQQIVLCVSYNNIIIIS